jgi:hypothetical protein
MDLATLLDILIRNPSTCPARMCSLYGKNVARFTCSRIFDFGDKAWQMRSIRSSSGQWKLFPFIVDTAGCPYNYPIISGPVLANLGLDRTISPGNNPMDALEVRLPLSISPDPFRQTWDSPRALEIRSSGDLRFNMVGGENAQAILYIYGHLRFHPDPNEAQIRQMVTSIMGPLMEVTEEVKTCFQNELKEMRRHLSSPDWDHAFDENDLELKDTEIIYFRQFILLNENITFTRLENIHISQRKCPTGVCEGDNSQVV